MSFLFKSISSIYKFARLLSLDVALGGVVFCGSIAKFYNESLPFGIYTSLFFSIWLIYTFDHLMDARKAIHEPTMNRHQFHKRNQTSIVVGMVFGLMLGVFSLLFVPPITLLYGMIVLVIVFLYFILAWKMKIFMIKEVLIASVYSTGVLLGPVSLIEIPTAHFVCLIFQIFGIALINLLVLSFYELENDQKDGQHSWAVRFGKSVTEIHIKYCIYSLLMLQALSFYWMKDQLLLQSILVGMTFILWVIFLRPHTFKEDERYRTFSDLIFFLPGIIFWS
ncbi:MAG: UbiA prenyltransferase family protein [Reichenbachiella sp.]